ncbi:hypothetical protein MMC27_003378 [Xylographa pallens]|nr:hypothetical protein [Xylographa pallens]
MVERSPSPAPAPMIVRSPSPAPIVGRSPSPAPMVENSPSPAPIIEEPPSPAPMAEEPQPPSESASSSDESHNSEEWYEDDLGNWVRYNTGWGVGRNSGTIMEDYDGDLIGNLGAMADYERTEWHIVNMHTANIIWWGEDADAEGDTIYVDDDGVITDEDGREVWNAHEYVREHHVVRIIHEHYDSSCYWVSEGNEDWIPTHERRLEAGLSVTTSESSDDGSDDEEGEEEGEKEEEGEEEEEVEEEEGEEEMYGEEDENINK